ncbi:hypothetical protein VCRA2113O137_350033 [Vibrio crassostreae]|nr:hypothetical protein VCRA2113O137_350033 [Vibrio crassostreae]
MFSTDSKRSIVVLSNSLSSTDAGMSSVVISTLFEKDILDDQNLFFEVDGFLFFVALFRLSKRMFSKELFPEPLEPVSSVTSS